MKSSSVCSGLGLSKVTLEPLTKNVRLECALFDSRKGFNFSKAACCVIAAAMILVFKKETRLLQTGCTEHHLSDGVNVQREIDFTR